MRKLMILGLASLLVAIPFATSAQEAFTTRSVNVRAGPDTSYPAVATLGGGAPVEVMDVSTIGAGATSSSGTTAAGSMRRT